MFKKYSPRWPAPSRFKKSSKEMPSRLTGEISHEEDILISELEESLENLRQVIRQGEIVAGKAAAALADDSDD